MRCIIYSVFFLHYFHSSNTISFETFSVNNDSLQIPEENATVINEIGFRSYGNDEIRNNETSIKTTDLATMSDTVIPSYKMVNESFQFENTITFAKTPKLFHVYDLVANFGNLGATNNVSAITNNQQTNYDNKALVPDNMATEDINIIKPLTNREPVKLTVKQNVVMNQVLNIYALSNIENSLCLKHIKEYKLGLRAFEPWALKMFDSSSKLMSGILNGNVAELGAFKQCLNVYHGSIIHDIPPIRGRLCTLRITPTDKLLKIILSFKGVPEKKFALLKSSVLDEAKLLWSVCVPDSCNYLDVLRHYDQLIQELAKGLNLTVSLDKDNCVALNDLPEITIGDYMFISLVGIILFIVAICTVVDIACKSKCSSVVQLFSVRINWNLLFSISHCPDEITCLHGIRFLSMCYIVTGHRYIHNMASPIVNALDLVDWIQTYFSTLVHGGTINVDSFLLISSTLTSYNFCKYISGGRKFSLVTFFLNRHFRIIVVLIPVIATYTTVIKHFGNGPLYKGFSDAIQKPCQTFWWSTILSIQPLINPEILCIVQTWSLTTDMFGYYLSPLMLFPLIKKPFVGFSILLLGYLLSVSTSFYYAWKNHYFGGMPVTPRIIQTEYFVYHYIQPYCRGSPYLIGLAFGYILFKRRNKPNHVSFITKCIGWILTTFCMVSLILINRVFYDENIEYNRIFIPLFMSCHRSIWTAAIMWIIWSCKTGNANLINAFLSHDFFKILVRFSFSTYLFHFMFQGAMANSKKTPDYFSDFVTIYMALSDIVLMIFLAIPLTLCFELPIIRGVHLIIKRISPEIKPSLKKLEKV